VKLGSVRLLCTWPRAIRKEDTADTNRLAEAGASVLDAMNWKTYLETGGQMLSAIGIGLAKLSPLREEWRCLWYRWHVINQCVELNDRYVG